MNLILCPKCENIVKFNDFYGAYNCKYCGWCNNCIRNDKNEKMLNLSVRDDDVTENGGE